jgi:hypothetical protein
LLTRAEVLFALGDMSRAVADLWAVRTTLTVEEIPFTHAEQDSFDRLLGQLLAQPQRGNDQLLTQLEESL